MKVMRENETSWYKDWKTWTTGLLLILSIIIVILLSISLSLSKKNKDSNNEINIPEINLPVINVPEINVPVINIPEINLPDINLPEINVPEINLPEINIPEINLPEHNVPELNSPDSKNSLEGEFVLYKKIDLNNFDKQTLYNEYTEILNLTGEIDVELFSNINEKESDKKFIKLQGEGHDIRRVLSYWEKYDEYARYSAYDYYYGDVYFSISYIFNSESESLLNYNIYAQNVIYEINDSPYNDHLGGTTWMAIDRAILENMIYTNGSEKQYVHSMSIYNKIEWVEYEYEYWYEPYTSISFNGRLALNYIKNNYNFTTFDINSVIDENHNSLSIEEWINDFEFLIW